MSLEELYGEILKSEELKLAFAQAAQNNALPAFTAAHGVNASMEEIQAFLENKAKGENEKLSVDELNDVAGGMCSVRDERNALVSIGVQVNLLRMSDSLRQKVLKTCKAVSAKQG